MIGSARITVALLFAGAVAACQEQRPPPSSAVRPVLSAVATPKTTTNGGFAGTIEPRYRSTLGFRVLGRMVSRDVNVGESVQKGRRLAALEPTPFELALQTARAEVSNATAQLENAVGAESRQRTLLEQKVIAEAQFEIAQRARVAASAALARARANLTKAEQQLSYTLLRADFDGVVTAVEAEVGQVVQPGQTVVTLARSDIREAVIDIPEDVNGALEPGARFEVALQLKLSVKARGVVREIAPQADPATRSRRVRITLEEPPASFRLGTTVTATMPSVSSNAQFELPVSAILERAGETLVWVVDPVTKTVSLRQVTLAARGDGSVLVIAGLASGMRVVTAGVNSLTPGQAVRIEEERPR